MQNPPPPNQGGYGYQYGAPPPPPNAPYSAPQGGGGGPQGKSSMGMDANVAALLAYVFTWLSGLIIFLMEKENRYVRFHAMQAVLLGAAVTVIVIVLAIVMGILAYISAIFGLLGLILWPVVLLAFLAAWIICMVKAYQGQTFKLPILGDMAQNIAK